MLNLNFYRVFMGCVLRVKTFYLFYRVPYFEGIFLKKSCFSIY